MLWYPRSFDLVGQLGTRQIYIEAPLASTLPGACPYDVCLVLNRALTDFLLLQCILLQGGQDTLGNLRHPHVQVDSIQQWTRNSALVAAHLGVTAATGILPT
jgi:hypothetical protein